jgi:uncharacterized membrane protein YtjA (UPF0391 family)
MLLFVGCCVLSIALSLGLGGIASALNGIAEALDRLRLSRQ